MVDEIRLPRPWHEVLEPLSSSQEFSALLRQLQALYIESQVYPPADQLFRAFELCPPERVKAVIVGQDPYHGAGQAHGLCFSVNADVKVPPSLKNIYKELSSDIPGFTAPASGDLSAWAKQGVLLLNAILTVKAAEPGSHRSLGWEKFTDVVIKRVSETRPAAVFLLWGNYAISKRILIDEEKHLVLTAPHPSPLARGGFAGCRHFSRTNAWLSSKGFAQINWHLT